MSARATSWTGIGGVWPRVDAALDQLRADVDGVVDPGAVGGLDGVVVARGLVEREQERPVLAERAHRRGRAACAAISRSAGLGVGDGHDAVEQLVEQAEDDVGQPAEVAVEDGPREARLGHHVVDREVAEAAVAEQPAGRLERSGDGLGGGDAVRAAA